MPYFWSPAFVFGMWGLMLGLFPVFEFVTRNFRNQVEQNPEGRFTINGIRVSRKTFETVLQCAARTGKSTSLGGLILIAAAIATGLWSG